MFLQQENPMKKSFWFGCMAAVLSATASHAWSTTLISDNFESDSSSDYTIATQDPLNGSVTFAFDYVAAGIPLAPRSAPGSSKGIKFTVNDIVIDPNNNTGANNTQTAFHNTIVNAQTYKLTVDVFMYFVGTTGTTEHAHVGVGGNGVTPNALFTPITGSGSFLAFTGDGGTVSDYRWFLSSANGGPSTVSNDRPSYLGHGSNNTGAFYSAFFPSPPSTVAGVPGNIWTTVEVLVDNTSGRIQYFMTNTEGTRELFIDNSPETLETPTPFSGLLQGLVSIGLHDAFLSVSGPNVFTVFDNLLVEEVTTGGTVVGSFVNHVGYSGGGSSIDSGKSLAQEGSGPTFLGYDNLINTGRGINGVAFDIQGLGNPGSLSAADFVFQVSPQGAFDEGTNAPGDWANAPAPLSVSVTPGTPDRVLITWADNSIENRWLRVTISANANTGLASPETYYIGHLRGETTGSLESTFTVAFADITPIRSAVGSTVDSSSITDIDKNGTVAFSDITAMRNNVGAQLTIITIP